MKFKKYIFVFLIGVPMFWACKKSEDLTSPTILGLDPTNNKDGLNKVLQMEGHFYDEEIPKRRLALDSVIQDSLDKNFPVLTLGGLQRFVELAEGVSLFLPFQLFQNGLPFILPSGFKICNGYLKVNSSSGHWKVPVKVDANGKDFFIDVIIPKFVREGKFSLNYSAEICGKFQGRSFNFITDTTTTNIDVLPKIPCGDTITGSYGLTIRKYLLGDKKGKVKVSFRTHEIGDRFDLKYNNKYLLSTGTILSEGRYPRCITPNGPSQGFIITNNTFKDYFFDYDPKISKELTFYALGSCNDARTSWDITISCPN